MSWVTYAALFFVVWWVALFASLPFGLRTQDDDNDVTLGTTSSAPRGRHLGRAMLRTTVVTTVIFGALYLITQVLGYGFDDIPIVVPDLKAAG